MKYAIVIPARYASTRFPGKPLAMLGGRPIINHVYTRASATGIPTYVATDDMRIYNCVESFGGKAVLTSPDHPSGTDRINEAVHKLNLDADVIINLQGDEPFITQRQITTLCDIFSEHPDTGIATLARIFPADEPVEALLDPNLVKVVFDHTGRALYFSRSVIPYVRGKQHAEWTATTTFHTHIGIYAYQRDVLDRITAMPRSALETAESLEQLRWLQNGLTIRVGLTDTKNVGIDTPADLALAEKIIAGQ